MLLLRGKNFRTTSAPTCLQKKRTTDTMRAIFFILFAASSSSEIFIQVADGASKSLRRRGRHLISRGSHKYTASSNMSQVDHEGNIIPKRKQSGSSTVMCEHYSAWATWSHCSRRCEQYRTRNCVEPRYCGNTTIKDKRFCKRRNKQCSILSFKVITPLRRAKEVQQIITNAFYNKWTAWSPCSRDCKQKRKRQCRSRWKNVCGESYIQQTRKCRPVAGTCEKKYTLSVLVADEPAETKKGPTSNRHNKAITNCTAELAMPDKCGTRPSGSQRNYRIVGGYEVRRHSWPWQVAILTRAKKQYCGGTLISPQWVLTAAHCVRKRGRKRKVIVRMGEHDLHSRSGNEITLELEKDFPHPKFDFHTISNDIALLKLKRPVRRSFNVGFACLPTETNELHAGTICNIIGWGKVDGSHQDGAKILREAEVPVVDQGKCQKAFKYKITNNQICAGFKGGGVDSCGGDSGGPLICANHPNRTTQWYVYGVTSYGEGCGQKKQIWYLHRCKKIFEMDIQNNW